MTEANLAPNETVVAAPAAAAPAAPAPVAPAPQAPATPPAPQAPAPEAKPAPEAAAPSGAEDIPDLGHSGLNGAVALLNRAKVPEEALDKIFAGTEQTGELTAEQYAMLLQAVGNRAEADLIVTGLKAYYNDTIVPQQEVLKTAVQNVHTAMGGQENFVKVRDWAEGRAKADPKFRAEYEQIKTLINTNPLGAKVGAEQLRRAYETAPGNKTLVIKMTEGSGVAASDALQPLGREGYLAKMKELQLDARKGKPGAVEAIAQLRSQRAAELNVR